MRIRTKLLLLLLGIALIPLSVVRFIDAFSFRQFGSDLAVGSRDTLIEIAEDRLRQTVEDYTSLLWQQRELTEMAVQRQALEVEKRLVASSPPARRVFFAQDFDRGTQPPHGLRTLPKYGVRSPGDRITPRPVSFAEQVFLMPSGVSHADVADDIGRLSTMVPVYRELHDRLDVPYREHTDISGVLWQYTGLASGLHSSFPGHGGYPADYDPRRRTWYQRAVTAGELTWSGPIVDATTGQLVFTVSVPVRGSDGEIAGVTAIDVGMVTFFLEAILPVEWADSVTTLMVVPAGELEDIPPEKRESALIVARLGHRMEGQTWEAEWQPEWLNPEGRSGFAAMLEDMRGKQKGVRRMAFNGEDSLWGYGIVDPVDPTYMLFIVPYSAVAARAEEVKKLVEDETFNLLLSTGIAVALTVLIVIGIAIHGSKTVTRPIHQLADVAQRMARGDFAARVTYRRRDELGDLGQTVNEVIPKLQDRELIRSVFGKYVPHHVATGILQDPDGVMQPRSSIATILYSDIQGFTAVAETTPPDKLVTLLNEYFDLVTEPIWRHGGVINQFQGDAMLVTFNVPVEAPDHAAAALRAATEIVTLLEGRTFGGEVRFFTRIGINTGSVVAGSVGAKDRLNYTVHGDAVNLAARLEVMNKEYGTAILLSESTKTAAGDGFPFARIGEVAIRGKSEHVTIYTLSASDSP